jgi:transcriptional regulator with XRE-family HTH domain
MDVARNHEPVAGGSTHAGSARAGVGTGVSGGPTVLRIGLGSELRRRRELAGITREAAGDAIRASTAKISRLELGRVSFKERDVADLLTLYQVDDPAERAEFLELARNANAPGWWHRYADLLPSWFETYLGLEQAAAVIRTYELQFVPGLLQTRDYARAVTALGATRNEEIERRVELRMRRQQLLTAPGAPTLWAVIDEAALRRSIGGTDLARAQLSRLLEVNEWPNVSLQIAPLSYGGHPAAGGPFTLLRFAQPDLPDIVYLEQLTSALYLDKRTDVEHYALVMDRLVAQVEPPNRTETILSRIRSEV